MPRGPKYGQKIFRGKFVPALGLTIVTCPRVFAAARLREDIYFFSSSLTSPFGRFLGYYDDVSSRVDNNNRFASFFCERRLQSIMFFREKIFDYHYYHYFAKTKFLRILRSDCCYMEAHPRLQGSS